MKAGTFKAENKAEKVRYKKTKNQRNRQLAEYQKRHRHKYFCEVTKKFYRKKGSKFSRFGQQK